LKLHQLTYLCTLTNLRNS